MAKVQPLSARPAKPLAKPNTNKSPIRKSVGRACSVQRPACLGAHLVDIFLWIIIANALTSESGLAVESVPVFSLVNSDLPDDAIMMV